MPVPHTIEGRINLETVQLGSDPTGQVHRSQPPLTRVVERRPMVEYEYLTLGEAAAVARVSKRTIQRLIRKGKLVRHGLGKRSVVLRSDLVALLAPAAGPKEKV